VAHRDNSRPLILVLALLAEEHLTLSILIDVLSRVPVLTERPVRAIAKVVVSLMGHRRQPLDEIGNALITNDRRRIPRKEIDPALKDDLLSLLSAGRQVHVQHCRTPVAQNQALGPYPDKKALKGYYEGPLN